MGSTLQKMINRFITWGFDLLYHNFSWMYNFAAWMVSAGRWNDWIRLTGEYIQPGLMLDLGCGKGILLQQAGKQNIAAIGLDESAQMLGYCKQTLERDAHSLVRGVGQNLPFAAASFQTITATFPAAYIFEEVTLQEIHRIMNHNGSLIILLTAEVTGSSLHEIFIRFFSRPFGFGKILMSQQDRIIFHLRENGFSTTIQWVEADHSRLLFIIGHPVQSLLGSIN
jgi:ubiquinone/menaquinone biosynthesis C-methylase UbiE